MEDWVKKSDSKTHEVLEQLHILDGQEVAAEVKYNQKCLILFFFKNIKMEFHILKIILLLKQFPKRF